MLTICARVLTRVIAGVGLAALAACGGGGSTETLYVDLSYPSMSASVLTSSTFKPTLSGLSGHTPHCSVSSGALPSGMNLADNCTISGTPQAAGTYSFTVHLTASDVSGSLDFPQQMTVTDPRPTINMFQGTVWATGFGFTHQLTLGSDPGPQWVVSATLNRLPGDTLTFVVVSGGPPPGTVFNATEGTLSGMPTTLGVYPMGVQATLVRDGVTYTSGTANLKIYVGDRQAQVALPSCVSPLWMVDFSCVPSMVDLPAGATVVFSPVSVPSGLSFNAANGSFTGRFSAAGLQSGEAQAAVTLPDGVHYTVSYTGTWYVVAPMPVWNDGTGQLGNLSGVLRGGVYGPNVWPTSAGVSVSAGVPFSIDVASVTDALPGDTHLYALRESGNSALPSWLNLDTATGRLSGTPPATPGVSFRVDQMLTTTRNGQQATSAAYQWSFTIW